MSGAGCAWGVPKGCLVCAKCVHGMSLRHNLDKVCRTHLLTKTCHTCSIKSKPKQRDSLESNSTQECHYQTLSMQQSTKQMNNA